MAASVDPRSQIEIKVAGTKVVLKNTGPDAEMARAVAKLVSERIQAAEKRAKSGVAAHQVVLLALMDLGEEYLLARKRTEAFRDEVEERLQKFQSRIEDASK